LAGVAGLIFSRGMDELAQRINRIGVTASVDTYLVWRVVANQAILDYRRDPKPITLIGHSMGGDSEEALQPPRRWAASSRLTHLATWDGAQNLLTAPGRGAESNSADYTGYT
jgi:hypothetical protein